MAQLFGAVPGNDLPDVPRYNVCPTTQIHALRYDGSRRLVSMRWGFVPKWYRTPSDGPLLINARGETLAEKPAFREAARMRRCLIPASGYYEWSKGADGARLPWYIGRVDDAPMALAGIWQEWGDLGASCAIVTTSAPEGLSQLHHRVPVMVEPEDWPLWLGEAGHGAARLMRAPVPGVLKFHRVSPQVNSNRASGPELIEPI